MKRRNVVAAAVLAAATVAGCVPSGGALVPSDITSSAICVTVDGESRALVFGFPVEIRPGAPAGFVLDSAELLEPNQVDLGATYAKEAVVALPSSQGVEEFEATHPTPLPRAVFARDAAGIEVLVEVKGTPTTQTAGFSGIRLRYESPAGTARHVDIPTDVTFAHDCDAADDLDAA